MGRKSDIEEAMANFEARRRSEAVAIEQLEAIEAPATPLHQTVCRA